MAIKLMFLFAWLLGVYELVAFLGFLWGGLKGTNANIVTDRHGRAVRSAPISDVDAYKNGVGQDADKWNKYANACLLAVVLTPVMLIWLDPLWLHDISLYRLIGSLFIQSGIWAMIAGVAIAAAFIALSTYLHVMLCCGVRDSDHKYGIVAVVFKAANALAAVAVLAINLYSSISGVELIDQRTVWLIMSGLFIAWLANSAVIFTLFRRARMRF